MSMTTRHQSTSVLPIRPGAQYATSSSSRHQPYAPPSAGSSHPHQHRPLIGSRLAHGHGHHNQLGQQARAVARERWSLHFGGPHYLEPGNQNRLVLSLRSGLANEIDFALERLIQVSGTDPDLLRLNDFPGLAQGLISVMRTYLDLRASQRIGVRGGIVFSDERTKVENRRACEAALVLRNIALERTNIKSMHTYKKLPLLVADVLEEAQRPTLSPAEDMVELTVHLLEVFEVIADHVPLALPGYAVATAKENAREGASSEGSASPSTRLFALLVALTRSTDRALVLSSLRCLTALSHHEKSEPVFALFTYNDYQPLPKPHPHPIETAIELLPISDSELSSAALDFIYQHTLIPSNAIEFCARSDLSAILALVCSKFHAGARKELVDISIPIKPSLADQFYKDLPSRHKLSPEVALKQGGNGFELEPEESAQLRIMNEPERTLTWMRLTFEADPEASITQVAFWTAYRAELEKPIPSITTPTAPLLVAAEVIKMSSEAFPGVMAMVQQEGTERKFIIKGLKTRMRTDLNKVFECKWSECTTPSQSRSGPTLYSHLHHNHVIPSTSTSKKCCWSNCDYVSTQMEDSLSQKELSLHVRVHIPTYDPSPSTSFSLASKSTVPKPVKSDPTQNRPTSILHHRYHALLDDSGEVAGLGFLSCIVLRNIARTLKAALGSSAGGASIHALSGPNATSIFEQLAAAQEIASGEGGGGKLVARESVWSKLEKYDYADAKQGIEKLLSVEDVLVKTAFEDHGLGKLLGEVLDVVQSCRKVLKKGEDVP